MKKINLLIVFLASTFATLAQTYTTGTVSLTTTAGLAMSVKIDVGTNVTLTLSGPAARWFALGFDVSSGMPSGTDVVGVHSPGTLTNFDAYLTGFVAPATDAQQDWTITSDQVAAGVRTIIATRALNTGDANDYDFIAGAGTLPLIWARGNTNSFNYAYHGNSNKGITNVTFSLIPPPPLTVTPTDTTICAGASTTLTASSSQGATFLWSPGGATTASVTISPTTTTTYTCVATLNGVSSTATSVVNVLAAPVVGVDSVTTCTPYLWNGNTYTSSGTYSVNLINANGCDSTANLVLTAGAAQVGGQSVTTCNSYIWNGNTYNSSGIYTDTLIATNGCDSISTLTLTIENSPPTPQVNMISMSDYVELSTQTQPGASYQWVICPTYDSIPGEDSTTMIVINNGNYAVIVTNACGSDTSTCVTVSTFLALDENSKEQQIFPTVLHCNDWLNLPSDNWVLCDLQGNKMATLSPEALGMKMCFPSGMYILSNSKKRHKIIVL